MPFHKLRNEIEANNWKLALQERARLLAKAEAGAAGAVAGKSNRKISVSGTASSSKYVLHCSSGKYEHKSDAPQNCRQSH